MKSKKKGKKGPNMAPNGEITIIQDFEKGRVLVTGMKMPTLAKSIMGLRDTGDGKVRVVDYREVYPAENTGRDS